MENTGWALLYQQRNITASKLRFSVWKQVLFSDLHVHRLLRLNRKISTQINQKGEALCGDEAPVRATHYKELKSRLLGRCRVAFLGFDNHLDVVIRQPGLQLFRVFLPLHLPIRSSFLKEGMEGRRRRRGSRTRRGEERHVKMAARFRGKYRSGLTAPTFGTGESTDVNPAKCECEGSGWEWGGSGSLTSPFISF